MKKTINVIANLLCALLVLVFCISCEEESKSTTKLPARVPAQYLLRQIMIDPAISPEHKTEIRKRAEDIMARAKAGEDFKLLAKTYSEEPGASERAGDLGFFTHDAMVETFSDAVFSMNPGEIRGLVTTQFGHHIIKLLAVDGEKRHAQHILFMVNPSGEDTLKTLDKLSMIAEKIRSGESFDTVFKQYNENETLKQSDGYMVWLTPDIMLPSFVKAIEGLNEGDIAKPFASIIGLHLIKVEKINYDENNMQEGFPEHIEQRLEANI